MFDNEGNYINLEAPQYEEFSYDEPTWSEILPGLWQGGTGERDDLLEKGYAPRETPEVTKGDFDFVVTLYGFAKPVDWFVREYRYGVYDSDGEDINFDELHAIAEMAHAEWKRGSRVLIRCQAGWNRSGLTMALVLMREGYSAVEAIQLIRERRTKWALCNDDFVSYLVGLDNARSVVLD